MGDVSGKGTSAALYMSKVQGIFQTLHEFNLSPVKLMTRANHLLYKHIDSKSYITAVGASFDTKNKTLSFARAGHLPLYYYNHNISEIRKIQPSGMGLGLSERNIFDYSIEEVRIDYSAGDIFLFVSDGVLEALNRAGEQFGEMKLLDIVRQKSDSSSKIIIDEVLKSVELFTSDTNQFDDITVVAVKAV
jgi:sigma-B regulation protein RsbU (phosphoserine phosphatase)